MPITTAGRRKKRSKWGRRPAKRPVNRPAPAKASPSAKMKDSPKADADHKGVRGRWESLPRSGRLLLGLLLVLVLLYAGALVYLRPASPGSELRLDSVTRLTVCAAGDPSTSDPARENYCRGVTKSIVEAKLLDQDARITGTLTSRENGQTEQFWTSYPKSDAATNALLQNLYASGAEVTVDSQTEKSVVRFVVQFLLPLVILADLFALLFMVIQGSSGTSQFLSFGKAGERRAKKDERRLTFADVAAAGEAVDELAEVRDYLANPSSFAKMGAMPPKGVLLMGPPGCGKTLLARATAGEVKATFLSMSGSEFVEALVGIGAARVRDLFAQARANSPAIVFIDELDAVGRQRGAGVGQGHDEREQTLNELLTQIDGFSAAQGIVVMAATNRPDILDSALLRAGRFDRHVTVERPDLEGRLEILRLHARGRPLADPEADLTDVAHGTPGFTGADLSNVLNEAALLAVRERASSITRAHLDEAVERVTSGPKRKGHVISEVEKRTIAYHEAGHAVVAASLGKAPEIRKISVISRGRGVGHLAMLATEQTVVRRHDIEAQIAVAMAGFAAEELVFGEPSSGSEADIERATHTARDMAGRYGMSTRLGPVRLLAAEKEVFLGRDYLSARDVSQPTLEHLDAEVRRILEEQKGYAASILHTHRAALDALAEELFDHETVQGPHLQEILTLPTVPLKKPRATSARAAKVASSGDGA
jgi:cell division protease FtsH